MTATQDIAKRITEVYFGGNWTSVNLTDSLAGVSWQQAITKVHSFNTIAALVFHIDYFVVAAMQVLDGKELNAHDKFSFDHPPIQSPDDWENLLVRVWANARRCAALIERLPDNKLEEDFWENKYGSYSRNLNGIIEHAHYHLGQIVLIRKLLNREETT